METSKKDSDPLYKIPEIAKVGTYVLFLSILLGVVEAEVYFQLFLHIPIFQYMEAAEVVLFSPATGITLLVYYLGIRLSGYFLLQKLHWFPKLTAILSTLTLTTFFFIIAFNNDQVIYEMIKLPLHYWWYLVIVAIFVTAFGEFFPGVKEFIDSHKQFRPILIAFWYGLMVGYLNYYVVTEDPNVLKVSIKLKSGVKISTDSSLVLAGRTKNYWFFYNRKTKSTRVIKDDEVSLADFSANNSN